MPYRKNMAVAKEYNDHQLVVIRRTIESNLTYYNAENNRSRSLTDFQKSVRDCNINLQFGLFN